MTSVPRDPAFWKRFATAVHEDEQRKATASAASHRRDRELEIVQSDWLVQQARERRNARRRMILCGVAALLVIAVIVLICVYLNAHGWYLHGEKFTFP